MRRHGLKHILDAPVKIDNTLAWDGQTKPFQETYSIFLNHPQSEWALCLRYGLCHSDYSSKDSVARIQGFYTDHNGKTLIVRQDFDLFEFEIVHTDQFITIGQTFLSLAESIGDVRDKRTSIKWEIGFEDPVQSLRLMPGLFYQKLFLPQNTLLTPRLSTKASGTLYVDYQKREFKDWQVYQNHQYGSETPQVLHQAACINFKEDSKAFIDIAYIQPIKKGLKQKPSLLVCLGMEGEVFLINSFWKSLFKQNSQFTDNTWEFSFEKAGFVFEVCVERSAEKTICQSYQTAQGDQIQNHLCLLSDITIKVYQSNNLGNRLYKTLTGIGKAHFESTFLKEISQEQKDQNRKQEQHQASLMSLLTESAENDETQAPKKKRNKVKKAKQENLF